MSILQHSSYTILPHEAEQIGEDNEIEARLRAGETVSYEDMEAMSEPRFRDLRADGMTEVPGEGYQMA